MPTTLHDFSPGDSDSRWMAFQSDVDAVREKYNTTHATTRLYALVDTRGLPDLRNALERLAGISYEALWDGSDLSAHKDISPLVIRVDLAASDPRTARQLLKRLWRFSGDGFMVTWIWSPYELSYVSKHFRSYCEYTLPDRRAFYLHFYDNRILERLRETWTSEEQARFASVGFSLGYRSRSGTHSNWSNEQPQRADAIPALTMSNDQHLRLLALGVADKIAFQISNLAGARLDHLQPEELHRAVHEQVERASRYRITDERDMLVYVFKGLFISPRFDEHPLIRPQLEQASYGRKTYDDVLSMVDERHTL